MGWRITGKIGSRTSSPKHCFSSTKTSPASTILSMRGPNPSADSHRGLAGSNHHDRRSRRVRLPPPPDSVVLDRTRFPCREGDCCAKATSVSRRGKAQQVASGTPVVGRILTSSSASPVTGRVKKVSYPSSVPPLLISTTRWSCQRPNGRPSGTPSRPWPSTAASPGGISTCPGRPLSSGSAAEPRLRIPPSASASLITIRTTAGQHACSWMQCEVFVSPHLMAHSPQRKGCLDSAKRPGPGLLTTGGPSCYARNKERAREFPGPSCDRLRSNQGSQCGIATSALALFPPWSSPFVPSVQTRILSRSARFE